MKHLEGKLLAEMLKFGVGGGSAVLTDLAGYLVLKNMTHVSLAKGISFVMGSAVGFVINKLWTFESRQFSWGEIIKYILLYAFSATINAIVNKEILDVSGSVMFGFLMATGVSTIINFLGQKFFVFKKYAQEEI